MIRPTAGLFAVIAVSFTLAAAGCSGNGASEKASPTPSNSGSSASSAPSGAGPGSASAGSSQAGTPSPTRSYGAKNPAASRTAAAATLAKQSPGRQRTLSPVPGGYEAATVDQRGSITFWRLDNGSASWRKVDSSRYPRTSTTGHVGVSGTVLSQMEDATFILRGHLTQRGSAVAYTNGPQGWGAITPTKNGRLTPSGKPLTAAGPGVYRAISAAEGALQVTGCANESAGKTCTGAANKPVLWRWQDTHFSPAGAR